MEIGGFFPYEKISSQKNNYFKRLYNKKSDMKHLMSGRCAIYLALLDVSLNDKEKIAYIPAYTCETVISAVIKANYKIIYYDVDKNLCPIFDVNLIDKISVLLISGYYGFSTYDRVFIDQCRKKGIYVIEDITHTAFSFNNIYPSSNYIVGSLRKWMGVISGGIAIKTKENFNIETIPFNEEHLAIRNQALELRKQYEINNNENLKERGYDAFWKAEWMLRDIFDIQKGDTKSLHIIEYYDLENTIAKRRENYKYLLDNLPRNSNITVIFDKLDKNSCPMFFPFLVNDREKLMNFLKSKDITPKVYWPVPPFVNVDNYPNAKYIYDHIMSISCDHRFSLKDMKYIMEVFKEYKNCC